MSATKPISYCYVARMACGCIIAAVVDEPAHPKDTAKSVAEFIREGWTVERMTCADLRASKFGCIHKERAPKEKQSELFAAPTGGTR